MTYHSILQRMKQHVNEHINLYESLQTFSKLSVGIVSTTSVILCTVVPTPQHMNIMGILGISGALSLIYSATLSTVLYMNDFHGDLKEMSAMLEKINSCKIENNKDDEAEDKEDSEDEDVDVVLLNFI